MIQTLTQMKVKKYASTTTWRYRSAGCRKWGQKLCQL